MVRPQSVDLILNCTDLLTVQLMLLPSCVESLLVWPPSRPYVLLASCANARSLSSRPFATHCHHSIALGACLQEGLSSPQQANHVARIADSLVRVHEAAGNTYTANTVTSWPLKRVLPDGQGVLDASFWPLAGQGESPDMEVETGNLPPQIMQPGETGSIPKANSNKASAYLGMGGIMTPGAGRAGAPEPITLDSVATATGTPNTPGSTGTPVAADPFSSMLSDGPATDSPALPAPSIADDSDSDGESPRHQKTGRPSAAAPAQTPATDLLISSGFVDLDDDIKPRKLKLAIKTQEEIAAASQAAAGTPPPSKPPAGGAGHAFGFKKDEPPMATPPRPQAPRPAPTAASAAAPDLDDFFAGTTSPSQRPSFAGARPGGAVTISQALQQAAPFNRDIPRPGPHSMASSDPAPAASSRRPVPQVPTASSASRPLQPPATGFDDAYFAGAAAKAAPPVTSGAPFNRSLPPPMSAALRPPGAASGVSQPPVGTALPITSSALRPSMNAPAGAPAPMSAALRPAAGGPASVAPPTSAALSPPLPEVVRRLTFPPSDEFAVYLGTWQPCDAHNVPMYMCKSCTMVYYLKAISNSLSSAIDTIHMCARKSL